MPRPFRIAILIAALPVALVVWASVVYAMDRASNGGEVLGPVSVADIELGGLSEEAALQAIVDLEARLSTLPVPVMIEGHEFDLLPSEIGFDIDEQALVSQAMEVGRTGGVLDQFRSWFGRFGGQDEHIGLVTGFSTDLLDLVLDRWEIETIADPPFEGGIRVDGTEVGLNQRVSTREAGLHASRVPMAWGEAQDRELLAFYRQLIRARSGR